MSFLGEIKRRKIVQVAAVYGVVAWLLIQIVSTVEEPLNLPGWFDTAIIVLLAVGFPVTLIISWAFNLTPEGFIRDRGNSGQGSRQTINYALFGLLALAVGFLFVDNYVLNDRSESKIGAIQSIRNDNGGTLPKVAVLPCDNLSPDPDDAYFSAGIHEEILNQLSKLSGLLVVARSSVLRYAKDRPGIPEIATELEAQAVLECSVRYAGDNIVVTAQLIDPVTDAHVFSNTYPASLSDLDTVFAIQASIASNIADALAVEFSSVEQQRVQRPLTDSPEAFQLYLKALNFPEAGPDGLGPRDELHQYLDRAIDLDPGFARAHALKAYDYAYAMARARQNDDPEIDEVERLAMEHIVSALSLDSYENLAYVAMGNIHRFNWRAVEAEAAYSRALQLAPNDWLSLQGFAHFLSFLGEYERAIELAQRATEINSSSVVLGWVQLRAGNYEAAISALNSALRVRPTVGAYWGTIICEVNRSNPDAALANAQLAEQIVTDDDVSGLTDLISAYGLIGQREAALKLFGKLEVLAASHHIPASRWAIAYIGIGEYEQALEWLEKVDEERKPEDSIYTFAIAINEQRNPALMRPDFVELRNRLALKR